MPEYFPEEVQKIEWANLKERRDWLRWIVPIEAVLLGLSVSLYRPESVLHHPYPSLLKWAWAFLALSIASGVFGATVISSVQADLIKHLKAADTLEKAYQRTKEIDQFRIRRPPKLLIRLSLLLCPILLAVGLGFLVLFGIWL